LYGQVFDRVPGVVPWLGLGLDWLDGRCQLCGGFAIKASAVEVRQLFPVVLLILLRVIVIRANDIICCLRVGLLWLWRSDRSKNHVYLSCSNNFNKSAL